MPPFPAANLLVGERARKSPGSTLSTLFHPQIFCESSCACRRSSMLVLSAEVDKRPEDGVRKQDVLDLPFTISLF